MPIIPSLALGVKQPNYAEMGRQGFNLGAQIQDRPEQRQMNELQAKGLSREDAQRDAMSAFAIMGSDFDVESISIDNIGDVSDQLSAGGLNIDINKDGVIDERDVQGAKMLIKTGAALTAQQMAAKGGLNKAKPSMFKQDELMIDEKDQLFNVSTWVDPNTQQMKNIVASVSGDDSKPTGRLSLTTEEIETGGAAGDVKADIASKISKAKTTAEYKAKLAAEPELAMQIAAAKLRGQSRGEAEVSLEEQRANMPLLEETVETLRELAPVATNTIAGRMWNATLRQFGQKPTKGATGRVQYQTTIDNVVLPLLKATFGAQFTEKEGARLAATLGDVDASPDEKLAALDAFMKQKKLQLSTAEKRVEGMSTPDSEMKKKQARIQELEKELL
jgi:hypothetical protein